MTERVKAAAEDYRSGSNCAQAVLSAFGDRTGLEESQATAVSLLFGGGVAGMGGLCGALCGALMALGCIYPEGVRDPGDPAAGTGEGSQPPQASAPFPVRMTKEKRQEFYGLAREIVEAFRGEYGAVDCRDLLERNRRDGLEDRPRPCVRYVERAAQLLEDFCESAGSAQ